MRHLDIIHLDEIIRTSKLGTLQSYEAIKHLLPVHGAAA